MNRYGDYFYIRILNTLLPFMLAVFTLILFADF